jgi:hypothetical protein
MTSIVDKKVHFSAAESDILHCATAPRSLIELIKVYLLLFVLARVSERMLFLSLDIVDNYNKYRLYYHLLEQRGVWLLV